MRRVGRAYGLVGTAATMVRAVSTRRWMIARTVTDFVQFLFGGACEFYHCFLLLLLYKYYGWAIGIGRSLYLLRFTIQYKTLRLRLSWPESARILRLPPTRLVGYWGADDSESTREGARCMHCVWLLSSAIMDLALSLCAITIMVLYHKYDKSTKVEEILAVLFRGFSIA